MVYMMTNKDKILDDIRLIKKIIEDSSIPLQLQFDCVDAMQRILNNAEVEHWKIYYDDQTRPSIPLPDLRVCFRSGLFILLYNGGVMISVGDIVNDQTRAEYIELLSFKGFTTDNLMKMDNEKLENLYIEYIVLAEDYVWVLWKIFWIKSKSY